MSLRDQTAIHDALRRFDRLAGLDEQQLSLLAEQVEIRHAAKGDCLLELGSTDTCQLFLLDGELELTAGDGARHTVRHSDPAARGPVSRLRPSPYRVTARSPVSCLLVEQRLLDDHPASTHPNSVVVEESLLASEPNELLDDSASHPLMFDVFHDLNRGRIVVPSDRDIAIRVGRALDPNTKNLRRLADVLAVCPALTLKVMRASRAAARNKAPLHSVKVAVERLGVEKTFALAVTCVLRESLRSESVLVRGRMRSWWERTMRVAAISAVLARMSERFDPEYARLIGLLHSIAEPVLLGYADRHPDLSDATALDNVVFGNRAELNRILLAMWDLPREIVAAAALCNHWGYDHSGEADYTDIMLVAQWHASIGGARHQRIPAVEDIPAFRRLGLETASPEPSLKIVEAAESTIDGIDELLSS